MPLARRTAMRVARPRKKAKTPATKASPRWKTRRGCSPACCTKPKIFSAMTGSTQGIKFKIRPPRNALQRMAGKLCSGAAGGGGMLRGGEGGGGGADGEGFGAGDGGAGGGGGGG